MSIVQISRIQHRSGLYENLPQLSKAELGYSIDTRQLFIGNGLITEGAPETGNTEILTQYSDILNLANTYSFKNKDAGYNPQTGNSRAQFNSIAYNGVIYVAVGTNGNIITSVDGLTWSNVQSSTTNDLLSIAYGAGNFVAVGVNGTAIYSTNGTVWQASGAISYTNINAITFGGSKFVAVTLLGGIYTSANGITWTAQTSGVSVSLNGVTYGNSLYIAVGQSGLVLKSSDAISWTSTTIGYSDILNVNYLTNSTSAFVAVSANNKAHYSSNGTNWYRSLVDSFVSSTSDGTYTYSLTSWGDVYKSSNNYLVYLATIGSALQDFTKIYNNGAGLFTALTASGGIYTSSNAASWTLRTSGVTSSLNGIWYDGTTWTVVGASGVILTSTNGTTFTSRTSNTTNDLIAITKFSTTTWVAVGKSGTIVTSPNATTWTVGSSGVSNDLNSVTVANLGGGTYKAIAVGTNGIGIASNDTVSWSTVLNNSATDPLGNTVSLSNLNEIIYATYTPPGGVSTNAYIVAGDHGVVAISYNSTSWATTSTYTNADFLTVNWNGTYFFVSGDVGLTYLSGQNALTWTAVTEYYGQNLLSPDIHGVATNGTLNVMGGQYGYLYTASNQFKYWKKSSTILPSTIENISYSNSQFITVGASGSINISLDGISWTQKSYSYGNSTTIRSIQSKLDDFVSVKDFGAKGDGVTDDTESINRALYELYCRTQSYAAKKILYFPAGNYIISNGINVPSNARVEGEGTYNTIITQTANPYIYPYITWVMYTADNLQQIGNLIGLNGAGLPNDITISNLTLKSLGDGIVIDTANRVTLNNIRFQGPFTKVTNATDTISNSTIAGVKILGKSLVFCSDINMIDCVFNGFNTGLYLPANQYASNSLIDSCSFYNLYYGVYLNGTNAKGFTISNSTMDAIYANGLSIYNATNFISFANYYKDVGDHLQGPGNPQTVVIYWDSTVDGSASVGDSYDRTDNNKASETSTSTEWNLSEGLRFGTYQQNIGKSLSLANNTTAALVSNLDDYGTTFGLEFAYSITRNSQVASGIAKFTLTSTGLYSIEDDRSQSGDVGVTFGYNGSTDITYTTDANGTGLINYAIKYFEML